MSFDITGNFKVNLNLTYTRTLGDDVFSGPIIKNSPFNFTFGHGLNQISQLYKDVVVLTDGQNTTLNLYDSGTIKDGYGNDLAISALKLLLIKNNSADANLLIFGGNSADIPILSAATAKIIIPPGGVYSYINPLAAGLDITTNKNLRLEHDGTGTSTMSVDIIAGGVNLALE